MIDPRLEDHVVGLELQLVELVEQRERAEVQHRPHDAAALQLEIDAIQEEMARSAEILTQPAASVPEFHHVDEARVAGAA